MKKRTDWLLEISHREVKQGGYLLSVDQKVMVPSRDVHGALHVAPDIPGGVAEVSAWTTLSAAKRHAATSLGRERIRWAGPSLAEVDGAVVQVWTATVETSE